MSSIGCIIVGFGDKEGVFRRSLQWYGADFAMSTYTGP